YPKQDRPANGPGRGLNPAIVHEGRVFIAPDDSPSVFAFDAGTGRRLWQNDDPALADVVHLLGVSRGRLIATANFVWSIDVKTGKVLRRWPENQPLAGYGRGILAGDSIYVPTKTEIHVIEIATGLPGDRESIKLQERFHTGGGNLAVGEGYLVVAQAE